MHNSQKYGSCRRSKKQHRCPLTNLTRIPAHRFRAHGEHELGEPIGWVASCNGKHINSLQKPMLYPKCWLNCCEIDLQSHIHTKQMRRVEFWTDLLVSLLVVVGYGELLAGHCLAVTQFILHFEGARCPQLGIPQGEDYQFLISETNGLSWGMEK